MKGRKMNLQLPGTRLGRAALVFATAAAFSFVVACGDGDNDETSDTPANTPVPQLSGSVAVDGSSTVFPITEAVAEEFIKEHRNVKVTVGLSGTGGGFQKFCNGETDISDASRPITQKEMDACAAKNIQYIELPVAYDALSVVVHPQNNWVTCITVAELKKMWEPAAQGTVTTWASVNPSWSPGGNLKLFGPGTDSGTFDYFTEHVMGKARDSRGDFTASEDDNVLVTGVASDKSAIGYFGLAYYLENQGKLKALKVDQKGDGTCVEPSAATVEAGTYPLSRPLFIYVRKDVATRPEVKAFVDFYMENAAELSADVGYVKFPDAFYTKIDSIWTSGTVGTIFSGKSGTVKQILGIP
jgi:phosphate transport system substrate-binding protein